MEVIGGEAAVAGAAERDEVGSQHVFGMQSLKIFFLTVSFEEIKTTCLSLSILGFEFILKIITSGGNFGSLIRWNNNNL